MTRARLESQITLLQDALGACEKILKNPIPLSYTRWGASRLGWAVGNRTWTPHRRNCTWLLDRERGPKAA